MKRKGHGAENDIFYFLQINVTHIFFVLLFWHHFGVLEVLFCSEVLEFYIERCVSRDKQQLQGKRGKYFNIGNNNEYSREINT